MPATQEQARAQIQELVNLYHEKTQGLSAAERKQLWTEDDVIHHFIVPLLGALGWPTTDPDRFKYEQHTIAGKPDVTMIPERGGAIFVEAKRLTVIEELAAARTTARGVLLPGQLSLPGMAVDRTKEEQQAINYAFSNNGTWAILTSFEKLRLFNARRDWLVFSFERPGAFLTEFDQLWEMSYERILEGSLDDLSNQRYREDVDTNYLHFINEWRERLARDVIDRIDENGWATHHNGEIDLETLRAVTQRALDRLVVARFAEDHFVIPPDTLLSMRDLAANHQYTFTLREHIQRFFREFDRNHNSALFARDTTDDAVFSDSVLSELITKLYEARYRAMTPDIMGNTYEQFLGKTLVRDNGSVKTADNLETRKKQGSYYTPQVIVRYLVDNSLGRYLYGTADGKASPTPLSGAQQSSLSTSGEGETPPPAFPRKNRGSGHLPRTTGEETAGGSVETPRRKTYEEIAELRVIDPACGSGSFLIYAYEVLADFYRGEIARIEAEANEYGRQRAAEGISPIEIEGVMSAYKNARLPQLENYPRLILEKHLYGVDLDPQAAEIATVNLMMRGMADLKHDKRDEKLPLILNQNIKVGNSLVGNTSPLTPLRNYGEGEQDSPPPPSRGAAAFPRKKRGSGHLPRETGEV